MTTPSPQPEFPALPTLAWITAATGAMGAINAMVLPGVFGAPPGIGAAAAITAIAVFIAGVLCVFPLVKARTSADIEKAFFLGMVIRVGVALAAWAIGVMALKLPKVPFAASLMLAYLPVLAIETYFINRFNMALHNWQQSQAKADTTQPPAAAAPTGHRSEKLA